jgi:O-antigen biosynthesis protein
MSSKLATMEFTGERFVPEIHGNIELEHLHRYLQACEIADGKDVLDIACGEGYGSAMLAGKAKSVVGVDISTDAINHARMRYNEPNINFLVGSCANIPIPDASIDLVVSFETLEHHDQHEMMMQEIKRVLRPSGVLLISSPDKYHYSVEPGYTNQFHVKELFKHEFNELLTNHFRRVAYFGQRIIYGSGIFAESSDTPVASYWQEENAGKRTQGINKPTYWIAQASDAELPKLASGLLEQPINESEIIHSWQALLTARDAQLQSLTLAVSARDEQLISLKQQIIEQKEQLEDLDHDASEDGELVVDSKQQIYEQNERLVILMQAVSERDGQLASLKQEIAEWSEQLASLSQVVLEREEQLIGFQQQITERNELLATLSQEILQRDEQTVNLKWQITERDELLMNLTQNVSDRDEQLATLKQQIAQQVEQLSVLEHAISEHDAQIASPKKLLAEQLDQLVSLAQSISERDRQLANLNNALSKYNDDIAKLSDETVRRGEWALRLDSELKNEREKLMALISSNSWRITMPLREGRRWVTSPSQQIKRYAKLGLRLSKRIYQAIPLSKETKAFHRNFIAKYFPRVLLGSGSPPASLLVPTVPSPLFKQSLSHDIFTSDFMSADWEPSFTLPTSNQPLVCIIIPIYGKIDYTLRCLASIAVHSPRTPFEVIVVDDCSPDNSAKLLSKIKGIKLLRNEKNEGFIRSCNFGASQAKAPYLYFLNNDTELTHGSLDER